MGPREAPATAHGSRARQLFPRPPPSPGCDTGAVAAPLDAVRSQHGAEGLRQIHTLWLFYIALAVPAHEPQTQTSPLWVQSLSQSPRKGMQRQNHAKSHRATRQKQSIMGRSSMREGARSTQACAHLEPQPRPRH